MARPPRLPGAVPRARAGAWQRALTRRLGRSVGLATGEPVSERATLLLLSLLSLVVTVLAALFSPAAVPPSMQVVPVLFGGLLLRRRALFVLLSVVAAGLAVDVAVTSWRDVRPGAVVIVVLIAAVALAVSRSREQVGITGLRGGSILAELRVRLRAQGELPPLPTGWQAEVALRQAFGAAFGGDFVVSGRTDGRLELALVDVSGKGLDAGTRALLTSGALGGLIGAVPPEQFLPAANSYLRRQDWDEGFATAVHVSIDLRTGAYRLSSAGHPPAAQFQAGSGRWTLAEVAGPILGLLVDVDYPAQTGVLGRGDALLLYTDGIVEVPGRDLAVGIDKLLGEAERLVPLGFAGSVERLVDAVAAGAGDDRALLLLWRD